MMICVETGEGVVGANSYVSTQYAIDFAISRDLVLPCSNQIVDRLIFRAMDYMESFAPFYCGQRVLTTQDLSWPRKNAIVNCEEVAQTAIPIQLKQAQVHTMIGIHAGFDPMQNISNQPFSIDVTVGPIREKFAESSQRKMNKILIVNSLMTMLTGGRNRLRFVKT